MFTLNAHSRVGQIRAVKRFHLIKRRERGLNMRNDASRCGILEENTSRASCLVHARRGDAMCVSRMQMNVAARGRVAV